MLKKISLSLCTITFTFALFLLLILSTVNVIIRPKYVKNWVSQSGMYTKLPDSLIQEAKRNQGQQQDGSTDEISFTDPGVQKAAKAALSAEFLQESTENFIDGNFRWASGKVETPDYNINILARKQVFADTLADYYKQRYLALPECSPGTMPTSTDLDKINCRPPVGVDVDALVTQFKTNLLNNKEFLPKQELTAETLNQDDSGQSTDKTFSKDSPLPKGFRILQLSPYVLLGVCALSGLGIIFLSETKKKGVRKIGWRMTISGVLALIVIILGYFAIGSVQSTIIDQGPDKSVAPFREILSEGFKAMQMDVTKIGGIIAGAILLIGVIILILTRPKKIKEKPTPKPVQLSSAHKAAELPEKPVEEPKHEVPSAPPLPKSKPPKKTLIQ